ncbi:MAG: hypothetical protein IPK10_00855 [Bacteroidetes bacterium]|nr:hypothetical protein [Bacteroidota bacterium]
MILRRINLKRRQPVDHDGVAGGGVRGEGSEEGGISEGDRTVPAAAAIGPVKAAAVGGINGEKISSGVGMLAVTVSFD